MAQVARGRVGPWCWADCPLVLLSFRWENPSTHVGWACGEMALWWVNALVLALAYSRASVS